MFPSYGFKLWALLKNLSYGSKSKLWVLLKPVMGSGYGVIKKNPVMDASEAPVMGPSEAPGPQSWVQLNPLFTSYGLI